MYWQAAWVDFSRWYRSSISELISNSYSIPVFFKNCQNPFAPDGEVLFSNPLSATAKYLKSSGIWFFSNISSIIGIQGNSGQTNYSASKAGIIGFTKALSKEIGSRNINVNAIQISINNLNS